MLTFESKKVVQITGVKRTRLQAWIERGWLAPSVQVAEGSGTRNIYSTNDLYSILVFKKVSESGLPRKMVGEMIKGGVLTLTPVDDIEKLKLMIYIRNGDEFDSAVMEGSGFEITDLLAQFGWRSFDNIYILNFAKIRDEIDQKIEAVELLG